MFKFSWSTRASLLAMIVICLSACGLIPEKGWILYQKSPFAGDQIVYISRDGVKSVNPQLNLTCIVRATDPKIIYFNDKTKVYSEMTIDEWKADLEKRRAGVEGIAKAMGEEVQKPLKKTGELDIAGIKATQYIEESVPVKPPASRNVLGLEPTGSSAEFCFANDIQVPAAFHLASHKQVQTPTDKGVLLRMATTTDDGTKVVALDTTRFERQDFPADTFTAPTGYKRVKNEMEVLMGEGAGQAMESLFSEFAKPETQKGVKKVFKTGEAAAEYLDSVHKELKNGQLPHSTDQSHKDMENFMKMMQGADEESAAH